MDDHSIAVWGLWVALVAAVAAIVAAIAAIKTLVYAKEAPTKDDLARVEKNTAESTQHLKRQSERDEFAAMAQAVPIAVTGESHPTEPLSILLTVRDRGIPLTRLGLYNEHGSLFGIVLCKRISDLQYQAEIPSDTFGVWFNAGRFLSQTHAALRVRVYMSIQGKETHREVPVRAFHGHRIRGNTSFYLNEVAGWV
jgi:hypothetical protein